MSIASSCLNALTRPFAWSYYKSKNFRLMLKARLPLSARVLEIGSGHNPWFRSNILCDRFLNDDTERAGAIKITRPLVIADACCLPFPDDSFDFVFASHVAEHIDDLPMFLSEIQRVAPAGYIETPNYLFEQTVGNVRHLWAFRSRNGVLCAERKWMAGAPPDAYHGMHAALKRNPFLALAYALSPDTRDMRFWWRRPLRYEIASAPTPLPQTKGSETFGGD